MKAKVAHISLNARGGAERLSISAIRALSELGIEVVLDTFEKPDARQLNQAYGESLEDNISKVTSSSLLSSLFHPERTSEADIHVNTHGDMLPFFRNSFSKSNSLVYCHYPIAGCLIDSEDKEYLDLLGNVSSSHVTDVEGFVGKANDAYSKMIQNSTVLTNSDFSRKAIFKLYGVDSTVVYPPVDTEFFKKMAFSSKNPRVDDILVISRFHRSKKVENAIHLARLLKAQGVGRRMIIVGNISPDGIDYYESLRRLTKKYQLQDFIRFETSASFPRLVELMQSSKVYLHPLPGEPFGISTVEAMSSGLIPVVPDLGGHTEFVPSRFQFHTFGEGVDAVSLALNAPATERLWMSHRAASFSVPNFVAKFKEIVSKLMGIYQAPTGTPSLMPTQRIQAESA